MENNVFIGFDGYIDRILKPISKAGPADDRKYFSTIKAMGEYLIEKSEKSCSIQLEEACRRMGGNGPIFGAALKNLGIGVTLMGMFGRDSLEPVFLEHFTEQELCSYSDPMETLALEFIDGKVMMCPAAQELKSPLTTVESAAAASGLSLQSALSGSLCAFLNWGEIYFMQRLWEEIFCKYFKDMDADFSKLLFFDPADLSSHSADAIREMLGLVQQYARRRYVLFSINENETQQLGQKLFGLHELPSIISALYDSFHIQEIIVHTNTRTFSCTGGSIYHVAAQHVESPVLSTGAGDNFNAGYCYGKLQGMGPEECILTAHQAAAYYLSHGAFASSFALPGRQEINGL